MLILPTNRIGHCRGPLASGGHPTTLIYRVHLLAPALNPQVENRYVCRHVRFESKHYLIANPEMVFGTDEGIFWVSEEEMASTSGESSQAVRH